MKHTEKVKYIKTVIQPSNKYTPKTNLGIESSRTNGLSIVANPTPPPLRSSLPRSLLTAHSVDADAGFVGVWGWQL